MIIVSGKQGSGKTTLQLALRAKWKENGGRAIAINFADVLYEMHEAVLEILHKYIPERPLIKDGPLLQLLGTEWGRGTLGNDIWIRILQERVRMLEEEERLRGNSNGHLLLIVGDCRFENELVAFPEALTVRLECAEEVRKARCSMWRANTTHGSEVGLDEASLQGAFHIYSDTEVEPTDRLVAKILFKIEQRKKEAAR